MKKTRILLLSALACSLAFSSCGFNTLQMPKKVKVRTDATYQFNVLNFDSEAEGSKFKVSDYFDLGKILEEKTSGDPSGSGINIYKYNNGSQYQQFLIHMPIKEIEFDFSESFKNMDFSTATQSFEFNQEFKIPDVGNLNQSKSIELSNIESAINTGVVVTGATSPTDLGLTFKSTADFSFESIKYNSGKLIVTAESSLDNDSISIYDGSTKISEGSFQGNKAELSLAGVTIKQTGLIIKYNGSDYGTGFVISVDANSSKIDTASGITIDSSLFTVPDTEVTFPVSLSENLQDVSITKGTLDIAITNPTSWSTNVIGNYSITISEAITPEVTIDKGDPTTDNLNGKSLQSGNIKATAHVPITLNDATIVFADPPKVQVTTDITKISAQVKLGDEFKPTISAETDVKDLKEYIKSITWEDQGAGFVVKAKNNLPAGNDISLTLAAPAIGVTSTTKPIASGTASEQEFKFVCGNGVTTDFTSLEKIEISGSIGLPTGSGSNTLKITDVTPGETYSVSLSVTPKFEWASAKVKMPDNAKFTNKMNTSINKKTLFSALGNDFADKIQISSLPLYIFATMPDGILGDGGFAGKIKSYYGDDSGVAVAGSSEVSILDGSITTGKMPELIKNAAGEVTNNFGKETVNFAGALNSTADTGTLWLDYDIGLDGTEDDDIDITPTQIESLQGKTSIKIDVALLMSMDFKIAGTINIDLMKLMNKQDSDLLGRTAATDTSAYEAYLSVVQSAAMEISNLKLPMNGDVALKMDLYKNGSGQTKEIGNGGSFALEVNPTELIKTYPLTPDIQIILGKQGTTSNFGLLKTMPVAGKISLKVKAKGDIPVFPFSEQN